MRIILTHPYCWPWVRRGSERFIAEYAAFLTQQGHEVITISSKPGRAAVEHTPDGKRILHRQLSFPLMSKFRVTTIHTFTLGLWKTLRRLGADVVHCLAYYDACVANGYRKRHGHKSVYQLTGPAVPHWFPRVPPDRQALRRAITQSDECMVHSQFVADMVQQHYGIAPTVIPVPIDLDRFAVRRHGSVDRPLLLVVADFDERRKGLRVVLAAFALALDRRNDLRLRLLGRMSDSVKREVLDPLPHTVRSAIEVVGVGRVDELPDHYRQANLTILPSMWEAYGMVVVESWACGTPVVVTNQAALSGLISAPELGATFEPLTDGQETTNAEGLADAINRALPLADKPSTIQCCRAQAEQFSWANLGPKYLLLYTS